MNAPCNPIVRSDRQGAFTLIELLVVIAILAALLTPAVRNALDSGRASHCIHNLRQIGTAVYGYTRDHDGWYPIYGRIYTKVPKAWQRNPQFRVSQRLPGKLSLPNSGLFLPLKIGGVIFGATL